MGLWEGWEVLERVGGLVCDVCCCWAGFIYLKRLGGGVEYEVSDWRCFGFGYVLTAAKGRCEM